MKRRNRNYNASTLRHRQRRNCKRKKSYSTEEQAKEVLELLIKDRDRLNVYLCSACKKYHIGKLKQIGSLIITDPNLF